MQPSISIQSSFAPDARVVIFPGDCEKLLGTIPNDTISLVVTSPPYNLGKEYEDRLRLSDYLKQQERVIRESIRVLRPDGSLCWQVGNYVDNGAIIPLDALIYPICSQLGLKLRNRIVWHFEHGLHCSRRLSGRYEVVMWFTKTNRYFFDLDPIRVPQKYPGKKYFKGPKAGQYSCNPLGKSPGDVWTIPNVKSNHVEKTEHPCQFPVELIERLVLSLTPNDAFVLDPFLGTGTSIVAALRHGRRGVGAEVVEKYQKIARHRVCAAAEGSLRVRPMNRPVFDPKNAGKSLRTAPWLDVAEDRQLRILEQAKG